MAAAQPLDSSAPSASSSSAQAVSAYRVAADDDREGFAPPVDPTGPVNCTILPPGGPDQFVAAVRASAAPQLGSEDILFPNLPGEAGEGIAEQPSGGGEMNDGGPAGRIGKILVATWDDSLQDYGNYYTRRTAIEFVAILAPAAVFANSNLDANFGNWYQTHVRSADTNRAADFFRAAGQRLLHNTRLRLRQVPGRVLRRPARHGALGRVRRSHHAGAAGRRAAFAGRAIRARRRAGPTTTRTNRTGSRSAARTAPAATPSWAPCPSSLWPT